MVPLSRFRFLIEIHLWKLIAFRLMNGCVRCAPLTFQLTIFEFSGGAKKYDFWFKLDFLSLKIKIISVSDGRHCHDRMNSLMIEKNRLILFRCDYTFIASLTIKQNEYYVAFYCILQCLHPLKTSFHFFRQCSSEFNQSQRAINININREINEDMHNNNNWAFYIVS